MKGLVAAIRSALKALRRAAAQWKTVVVEVGGRMISMLVPSGVPAEADEPETVEAAADDFGERVRALAGQLIADGTPNPDLLATLPDPVARWLSVLDDSMLRSVMRTTDEELSSHLRGRKGLRGVIWSDQDAVDAWIAEQTDRDLDDPEVEFEMAWRAA